MENINLENIIIEPFSIKHIEDVTVCNTPFEGFDKALEKASTNTDISTQKMVRVSKKIQKINDEIIKDIDNIMKNNLT